MSKSDWLLFAIVLFMIGLVVYQWNMCHMQVCVVDIVKDGVSQGKAFAVCTPSIKF